MAADTHHSGPNNVVIWVALVVLLAAGFAVFEFHMTKLATILLIFGIAIVKAWLVVRYYMHLRGVPRVLYFIAGVPLILAITMVLILFPDIALRR
jgi:caa(3)-type oxidase subunit IV